MLDSAALLDLYQQGRAADALTRAGLLGRLVAGDGDEDEAGATEPTSVGDDGVEPETPADGEDDLI